MNLNELIQKLAEWSDTTANYSHTCDTVKCGNPEKPIHKIAVSMFGTPDVVRMAKRWGADVLIVHEPLFYDHMENKLKNDPVTEAKTAFLEESGLAIYRFHDHPHRRHPDMICEGELKRLGLKYKNFTEDHYAVNRIELETPITPRNLGRLMQEKLNIAQPKLAGAIDQECSRISLCFGTPGGVFEQLQRDDVDLVLIGEVCEWMICEYARDAAQLGFRKSVIVMGHIGSERDGMRLLAEELPNIVPECEATYFECGEVFSYPR